MNKDKARQIAEDIKAGLEAVAAKHGLTVTISGGRFDDGSFKPKVEFAEIGNAAADFARYAPSFGLQASDYGKVITHGGRSFTVTGLRLNAPKRPVLATDKNGKTFIFTVQAITGRAPLRLSGLTETSRPFIPQGEAAANGQK